MRKIKVNLGKRSYYIYIGYDTIQHLPNLIHPAVLKNPILIITNKGINSLFGKKLLEILNPFSNKIYFRNVPDSEQAKSFKTYEGIISILSKIGRRSRPAIFALGGGVVGDIAGFSAATYRRGIPYIQVPTTLLSQVDSSIGGKVAIDLPQAKNIVGSFYQPSAVIIDTKFLSSLPKKEVRNGMAEVIKYGIIKDRNFFKYLERNLKNILNLRKSYIEYIVYRCAAIKAGIVEKDEFDTKDIRAVLNFGHTFGHAIESAFKYSKEYTHGEAVSIGMVLASNLAFRLRMIKIEEVDRIKNLIKHAGFPISLKGIEIKGIIQAMDYDKKFLRGRNRFILPIKIGSVKIIEKIPVSLIRSVLYDAVYLKK